MLLLVLLLIPFLGGVVTLLAPYRQGAWAGGLALGFSALSLLTLGAVSLDWNAAEPIRYAVPWMPAIGLDFALWLDGPAMFWAWLVLGIGALVLQYANAYMDPGDNARRFYASMQFFIGAMLGVVISSNVLLMVVFWELTSLTSFLLIGHWHYRKSAIAGARRALLVTGLGGLSLLAGVATLFLIVGGESLEWSALWARRAEIVAHPWAVPAMVLILIGAFTKSAQFPFHFWLPGAMEAPTPVSALLHAATMVKAGIYLLGRVYPIFGDMPLWIGVAVVGLLTVLWGGFNALLSHDLKQLLAWSTVSQLGLLTSFYGFGAKQHGTVHGLDFDLALVLSHAMFKAALFMLCGSIDHGTHTRDWRKLGGLAKKMPATALLSALACASMAGVPLTFGFIAKKIWLEAAQHTNAHFAGWAPVLLGVAVLGGCFTMAYSLRFAVTPFFGKPREPEIVAHAHEGSPALLAAPTLLVGICVLGGVYAPALKSVLAKLVQPEFYRTASPYVVAMFKHLDLLTMLSLFTYFIAGPVLLRLSAPLDLAYRRAGAPTPMGGAADWLFGPALLALAERTHRLVQSPSLARNSALTFVGLLAIVAIPAVRAEWPRLAGSDLRAGIFTWITVAIACACVPLVVFLKSRIQRVLSLGMVGIAVICFFVVRLGPDLAMTLILVELLSLLMMLFLLRRLELLPPSASKPSPLLFNGVVAVSVAALFAGLTLIGAKSLERTKPVLPGQDTAAQFYLKNTYQPEFPGAHSGKGRNAVNVTLVDFRGFDTMGEIAVLAIAACGVSLLFGRWRDRKNKGEFASQSGEHPKPVSAPLHPGHNIILRTTAPTIALLSATLALVLYFAGHNAAGGGFIGGLLAGAAVVPFLMAYRRRDNPLPFLPSGFVLIPLGLLFAVGTGIAPMFFGDEFLHSYYGKVTLPIVGAIGLPSAALFDLGVFLLVVGMARSMLQDFGGRSVKP